MPHCIALGCRSHSGRKRGERFSFHSFPKNLADARVWYARCGTDLEVSVDKFNPAAYQKVFFLCSKHFKSSDFTTEMQEKLGFKVKRELKKGALPTLFTWQSNYLYWNSTINKRTSRTRRDNINRIRKKESQAVCFDHVRVHII